MKQITADQHDIVVANLLENSQQLLIHELADFRIIDASDVDDWEGK